MMAGYAAVELGVYRRCRPQVARRLETDLSWLYVGVLAATECISVRDQ
jgi:hypothetical protein